jgi:hypothetical protein
MQMNNKRQVPLRHELISINDLAAFGEEFLKEAYAVKSARLGPGSAAGLYPC